MCRAGAVHRNFFENGQVIGVVDKYFEVFQSKNYCTNTAPILPSHETLTNTEVNTYCKYYSILSKHLLTLYKGTWWQADLRGLRER